MKARIQDLDVNKKTIILRCDYNVPIKNGEILDDTKIKLSLETIEYLLERDCKIVILSHLGKVKSEEDKLKNTLEPVARKLNELLGMPIAFSKQCRNLGLAMRIRSMQAGEILLLENTRFEDFPNKLESTCDPQLSMYWANLGDMFINDAFGASHRKHASTYGIAKYIPSAIGFLMQNEIAALDTYVLNPQKPFTVIMGGSKVEDKLLIIEKLIPKCDYLLLGGGLANNFLHALGLNMGFVEYKMSGELKEKLQQLMLKNRNKIMLPLDAIVASSYEQDKTDYRLIDQIEKNDIVYDIGSKTITKYKTAINESETIFVNGTMGVYEDSKFANGTRELLHTLAKSTANVVVGGGDGASAARKFGYDNKFTYISSGGGATLEYIATEELVALEPIPDIKEDEEYEILDL